MAMTDEQIAQMVQMDSELPPHRPSSLDARGLEQLQNQAFEMAFLSELAMANPTTMEPPLSPQLGTPLRMQRRR